MCPQYHNVSVDYDLTPYEWERLCTHNSFAQARRYEARKEEKVVVLGDVSWATE